VNICVDIGNTNATAGLFEGDELVREFSHLNDRGIIKIVRNEKPDNVLVSSVRRGIRKMVQETRKTAPTLLLDHQTLLPFQNHYETPETLGRDRIAAVAGAGFLHPNKNCLIIDAGTCITYDLLDKDGKYHGGAISPGLDIRLKAMHKYTSRLPLLAPKGSAELIGKSTKACMLTGSTIGAIAEIEGFIALYKQFFGELTIIMCGGSVKIFESKIKGHIFAVPNLVLIGLNRILRFNLHV
jgi:type III pantothenate kinase